MVCFVVSMNRVDVVDLLVYLVVVVLVVDLVDVDLDIDLVDVDLDVDLVDVGFVDVGLVDVVPAVFSVFGLWLYLCFLVPGKKYKRSQGYPCC